MCLEFFCVRLLYADYLSDLHKFQAVFTYNINVEYRIWSFCNNMLWDYADNRYTDTHTHTHSDQL